jgi:hypothetical protein
MEDFVKDNFAVLALISISSIIGGIIWWLRLKNLLANCTAETIGKIISAEEGNIDELWDVVVQFNVEDNLVLTKKISTRKRPPKIRDSSGKKVRGIGQEVAVLYNPDNTNQYYVKGYSSTYTVSFLAILFGLALAAFICDKCFT